MKKLVLTAIVAFALAATSCGSKTSEQVSTSDMKTKIENCTNPDSLKVYVDQAKDYAKKLVDEGKIDEAQKYLDQIEPVVKEKAPALSSTFDAVNTALGKVEEVAYDKFDKAKEAASVAGDSVSSAASNAAEGVKEAAGDAVEKAKDATEDAAQKAKDATVDAAKKAKDATVDAAHKAKDATEDAAEKAKEKVKDLF